VVSAKAMVNAAGPWVAQLLAKAGVNAASHVRLIKGSHIVVDQVFEGEHAYMLQLPDKRIVFAIAYQDHMTLIGTTDEQVEKPEDAVISAAEIDYLCTAANLYFKKQIAPADVRATYSGVRPLYDDGASEAKSVTRDYVLELDEKGPPLLSVFGGKITTSRHLAQEAVKRLGPLVGHEVKPVTETAPLPGGDLNGPFPEFLARVRERWPFLGAERSERMARAYGTMVFEMLDSVADASAMGADFGGGLTRIEIDWLITHEWATTAEDILMRRTKVGLATDAATSTALTDYLNRRRA
jgi:glycerol-3-phosphate dehydrogenase